MKQDKSPRRDFFVFEVCLVKVAVLETDRSAGAPDKENKCRFKLKVMVFSRCALWRGWRLPSIRRHFKKTNTTYTSASRKKLLLDIITSTKWANGATPEGSSVGWVTFTSIVSIIARPAETAEGEKNGINGLYRRFSRIMLINYDSLGKTGLVSHSFGAVFTAFASSTVHIVGRLVFILFKSEPVSWYDFFANLPTYWQKLSIHSYARKTYLLRAVAIFLLLTTSVET